MPQLTKYEFKVCEDRDRAQEVASRKGAGAARMARVRVFDRGVGVGRKMAKSG